MQIDISKIKFDSRGLVPAVVALNTFVTFPAHPLPPVSLHVPVIVRSVFLHAVLPPLDAQDGATLSIFAT